MTNAPSCVDCRRRIPLRHNSPDGRICRSCYNRRRIGTCGTCREVRRIIGRALDGSPTCERCKNRVLLEKTMAAELNRIVSAVLRVEPHLDHDHVTAAVERVAPLTRNPLSRRILVRHLNDHPDALTSGASSGPLVLARLVVALRELGATAVVEPRCSLCHRSRELPFRFQGGRICHPCYERRLVAECARCGVVARIRGRTGTGEPLCTTCYYNDPDKHKPCDRCGRVARVEVRVDGRPLCQRCYEPPASVCDGCGETRRIHSRSNGTALCGRCYRAPKRTCAACGRVRPIGRRTTTGSPDVCTSCYELPVAVCSCCGNEAPCRDLREGSPRCDRCALAQRLDALLAGPNGSIAAELIPLRDAMLAANNPQTVFGWLRSSSATGVLTALAAGAVALTHEALDRLPQSRALDHLRALLVASGGLPYRNPQLAKLEAWTADMVGALRHPEDRRLLQAFVKWRVLRRLRVRIESGKATYNSFAGARAQIRYAARFMTWLRDNGRSLDTCRQGDVDRWLVGGSPQHRKARDFVVWAIEQRIAPELNFPYHVNRSLSLDTELHSDARWTTARRLLHDDALDVRDRVAGAFVVLYAQPLSRIARLTQANLTESGGELSIRFGRDDVLVPEPLAWLVRQLPYRSRIGAAGLLPGRSQWLFPGDRAGHPITAENLGYRLRALGIDTGRARSAALLELSAQVPASVLADLLNLHPSTAMRWANASGGQWTRYAARRATPAGTKDMSGSSYGRSNG